jgi:hypothetical protein
MKNDDIKVFVDSGEAKKLKEDGSVDLFKSLYNESIEIIGFLGSIQLEDNSYVLRGVSSRVKGINFNWFG